MKMRFITTFVGLLLSIIVFAGNNDITMVSYEQSWLDSEGTLALRNNTNKEIKNVTFQITYLDMQDNELDYESFTRNVTIAPGKTKKINIPAYEYNRFYHYYKTKDSFGRTTFKIQFQLKNYNVNKSAKKKQTVAEVKNNNAISNENVSVTETSTNHDSNEIYNQKHIIIVAIVLLIVVLSVIIGSYVLVAVMAQRRNRNAAVWVFLSFIASPLIIIIILLCIGDESREND